MKILYVLNSGNPGGMEKHVLDLVEGMVSRKHTVCVWCPEGPIIEWFENAGATVFLKDIRYDIDPLYIRELIGFLRLEKVEVAHAHELRAAINTLVATSIVGTEVRVTHTHTPITEWRIGPLKKLINIFVDTFMINVYGSVEIALTKSRKRLKSKEGIREWKMEVIPNALDTKVFDITPDQKKSFKNEVLERYGIPKNAKIIGNVSRMTREKGHMYLVEAFAQFLKTKKKKNDNYYLFLAGGGRLEDEVRLQVEKLGIADRTVITGVFPFEDLIKYYSSIDFFVFPTLAEGFGYVLVEAMYMEIPVICTDLEVLREVGKDTVTYFKKFDIDDLVSKINKSVSNTKETVEKAKKAKKLVVEEYSLKKFIDSYEKLYMRLYKEAVDKLEKEKK